jgi:hypothetical protein
VIQKIMKMFTTGTDTFPMSFTEILEYKLYLFSGYVGHFKMNDLSELLFMHGLVQQTSGFKNLNISVIEIKSC